MLAWINQGSLNIVHHTVKLTKHKIWGNEAIFIYLGYGGYNKPHVNNTNFNEYKFALLILHTTEKYLASKNSIKIKKYIFGFEKQCSCYASAIYADVYGNRNDLIIFKLSHN